MATDEILTVRKVFQDGGDWCVKCPHCKKVVGLPSGPIKGEQFQHSNDKACMGWFDVAHNATAELP